MASHGEEKTEETAESPRASVRSNRLEGLIVQSRKSLANLEVPDEVLEAVDDEGGTSQQTTDPRTSMSPEFTRRMTQYVAQQVNERLVEVRLKGVSYNVPVRMDAPAVKTVMNQSLCYGAYEGIRRVAQYCRRPRHVPELPRPKSVKMRRSSGVWMPKTISDIWSPFRTKPILHDINLVLKPGKTYLILGPPGCGKTTLLKAIAGLIPDSGDEAKDKPYLSGRIEYNGITSKDDTTMVLPNVVSFVGEHDIHAPYLTVRETFDYAFQCRTGGNDSNVGLKSSDGRDAQCNFTENLTIDGLDLAVCADTFVGNDDVRGVSGGQRRRVSVGEMMQGQSPVACADQISTGLDAAVTYDIIFSIVRFSKAAKTTRVVSLLQPGPETVSLFDEVVLLSDGRVIYTGPIEDVVDYFAGLGYKQPATMDVADYLQSIPTVDGCMLFDPESSPADEHYTSEGFAEAFKKSAQYQRMMQEFSYTSPLSWKSRGRNWLANGTEEPDVDEDSDEEAGKSKDDAFIIKVPDYFKIKYQNSFRGSLKLNFRRHLTLWKRDTGFIIGKMFENIGMAVATGGILFGQARVTWDPNNVTENTANQVYQLMAGVYGAQFMTAFHIILGTMTSAPDDIDNRPIHYKHYDAKFYQVYSYVLGHLASTVPQRTIEICSFGIPLYWMVGFDPTAGSFFMYLALLICYTIGVKMMFGILAQILPKKANVQGVGTFVVLLATLFSGFIVFPNVIPPYYIWIYWINPMAWALQGLASIEFTSTKYDNVGFDSDLFLQVRGFKTGRAWIGYSFAFMIPFTLIFSFILGVVLKYVRIEPGKAHVKRQSVAIGQIVEKTEDEFNLPFTPVGLTFENLVYEVKASTGNEILRILNEVSGAFMAGRMCALMGSSGAGKTTLMDVIAMRKTSGTTSGEIRLNGFPQERTSFLRCSGYVEQFDIQQAELTIRETVVFCARLRLDEKDPAIGNDAGKQRYVDHVLDTMELSGIQNLQVGSYEEGGLTFEQRKRLAIACELAGSPSVIFLDEPTSGLDSRGALVVMRAMKRIADTGRTVCATIHQPSSAVFSMFDDLILLKKGGNVVFFGELGGDSCKLIEYFETRGASPIEHGENPAAWMLRAYAGEDATEDMDWAEAYKTSDQYIKLQEYLEKIKESPTPSKKLTYESTYVTTTWERIQLMNRRVVTVYKRSPAYNLTRLMIAIFYGFIIGSVFLQTNRRKNEAWSENDVAGVLSTMFLSLIITGVTSISMAVPVMKKMRDVFYKHRASGMLSHNSLAFATQVGETPYICLIAVLFGIVYYACVGLFHALSTFGLFWVFFALSMCSYTYFGQAFICLVKDEPTAGALVGALIGYNVFFSGLIVKPQYFSGPFQLGLWTAPGRFAFEGLVVTQFDGLEIPVVAQPESPWYFDLGCGANATNEPCEGTMDGYVNFAFGGLFTKKNFWLDVGVLLGYLVLSRFLTWFALKRFNYVNT